MWLPIYFVLGEVSRSGRQDIVTSWDASVHSMAWWEYFRWLHFNCYLKKKHSSVRSCFFTILLETQSSHSSCCMKETLRWWQATELVWRVALRLISWAKTTASVHTASPLQLESKTCLDCFQSSYNLHLQWARSMHQLTCISWRLIYH